jgi:hypothetical protein
MIAPKTASGSTLLKIPQDPGGHQPTWMEQRLKSALLSTFGKRKIKLTGHEYPCNMH